MGAVAVVVHRVGIVVEEVPTADIVDIAVAVIIPAIAGDLAGVGPDIGFQVGVGVIHTGVDDSHHRLAGSGCLVPRLGRIDVGIEGAACLACVVHAPELGEAGVVGDQLSGNLGIGLNQLDFGIRFQGVQSLHQTLTRNVGLIHPWHQGIRLGQLQSRGIGTHGVIRLGTIGQLNNHGFGAEIRRAFGHKVIVENQSGNHPVFQSFEGKPGVGRTPGLKLVPHSRLPIAKALTCYHQKSMQGLDLWKKIKLPSPK